MIDVELVPSGASVQSDLSTAYIGTWTANGIDRPTGWAALIKPFSNATSTNLTWELRNATQNTTYLQNFLTLADWNSNRWGVPDQDGYKLIRITAGTVPYAAPNQNDFVWNMWNGQAANQWSIKSGTLAGSTFQLTAVPVPEPGSIILTAVGIVAMAILGWRKRRNVARVA